MSSLAERRSLSSPPPQSRAGSARRARARLIDRAVTGALWLLVSALVALLAYFIGYTLLRGAGVINWRFITGSNVQGTLDGPEVFNTFYIIGLALILCVPAGVCAAIYLVEYASQSAFTTVVRFATETLAGVPSIVLGFFGYLVLVTNFGDGHRLGYSRLAAAITLAILNLPLIVRISEDALRSVPSELREGSIALGATKSQTINRVLVPSSLPQFTTGIILTAGKMIGETAAIIFTGSISSPVQGWFTLNPLFPGDTLTVHLYALQAEGIVPNAQQIANGTATLLIALLLIFNLGLRWLAGLLITRTRGRNA